MAQTNQARTDLIWSMATLKEPSNAYQAGDVVKILNAMYPGINFWHSQLNTVVKIACQDIRKAMPQLTRCKTDDKAVQKLGSTITIPKIRTCDGYEWANWQTAS